MKSNINYKKNLKIDVKNKTALQLLIKALETKISKIVAKRELEIYRTTKKKYLNDQILTKINTKRQPKVKLTFVNGQFVDLQTIEGQEIVEGRYSSSSGVQVDRGESGRRAAIQGILTSHPSGHCGILGTSSSHTSLSSSFIGGNRPSSPSPKLAAAQAMSKMSSLTSFSRAKSDASTTSIESADSYSSSQMSTFDSDPDDGKNAATSIVALGNGFFLTASKCDRVSSIV